MKAAASDARKTAASAISSGRPRRPIGCRAIKRIEYLRSTGPQSRLSYLRPVGD